MCPFCIGTALWIAAGAVTTGGVSALAVTKFWSRKTNDEGASNAEQSPQQ